MPVNKESEQFEEYVEKCLDSISQYLLKLTVLKGGTFLPFLRAEVERIKKNSQLKGWQKLAYVYKNVKHSAVTGLVTKLLQGFSDGLSEQKRNAFYEEQMNVPSAGTGFAIEDTEKRLVRSLSRSLDELAKLESREILFELEKRIKDLHVVSPRATGIKRLKDALCKLNDIKENQQEQGKEKVIFLLLLLLKDIVDERRQIDSLTRKEEIQIFYDNVFLLLLKSIVDEERRQAQLIPSSDNPIENQQQPKEEGREFFSKLLEILNEIKNKVDNKCWDSKGQAFFATKTPAGINQLRRILMELPKKLLEEDEIQDFITNRDLIKKFMEIYYLTKEKTSTEPLFGNRDKDVRSLYENISEFCKKSFNDWNLEQQTVFNYVYQSREEKTETVLESFNSSRLGPALFSQFPELKRKITFHEVTFIQGQQNPRIGIV